MSSIPFSIPDVMEGFAETEGLARLEKEALILEFQTKDSIIGLIKSAVKEVRISFSEIESIKFEKKIFKTQLIVNARSMSTFSNVPGNKQGVVTLRFRKKNKDEAEHFASSLDLQLSEYKLKQLDQEMDNLSA